MKKLLFISLVLLITFPLACENSGRESENKSINLTDAKIRLYKTKIDQDPANYINYDNLAQNYIQKARETGDANYYHEAEKSIIKSIEINPRNYTGIVLFARTEMAMHRFNNALKHAQTAVNLQPHRTAAYGVLGDAYLELGYFKNAEDSYNKMIELKPSLDAFSRISILNAETGNLKQAIEYMQKAYVSGLNDRKTPPENIAWTQAMKGIFFVEMGNYDEAERSFKKSLEIYNDYFLALDHLDKIRHLKSDKPSTHKHHKTIGKIHQH